MSYALCQKILTETVPPALAEATRLADLHRKGTIAKLDLAAHDAKLRKVIEELVFGFAKVETRTGFRTFDYEIEDKSPGHAITAIAPMAFCPESALIVHAPIMLGRVIAIATNLLDQDNPVIGIKYVRIRKPIITDLRFTVTDTKPALTRNHVISGQLRTKQDQPFWFYGEELTDRPVAEWIDNHDIGEIAKITFDPENPVRHFLITTCDQRSSQTPLTLPEAVQILLETVIRTIVIHRNRDGRGILLAGIPEFNWPADLAERIAQNGDIDMLARPLGRMNANSPWHRVPVDCTGSLCTGTLDIAEARTTLSALFR